MQPDTSGSPVAIDGSARQPHHLGYLWSRQTSEEFHLHDFSLPLIDPQQLVQSIVEGQKLGISMRGQCLEIVEGDSASPVPFARPAFSGVVHKNLAHEPGCHRDEMTAVLEMHRLVAN